MASLFGLFTSSKKDAPSPSKPNNNDNEDKKLNTGEGTLQFTKYSWILFKYE